MFNFKPLYELITRVRSAVILTAGILLFAIATGAILTSWGLLVALVALMRPESKLGRYGFQVWIAFDKFGNAVLGGDHRETISSRLGKSIHYGHPPVFGLPFIDNFIAKCLDTVDPNHCLNSIDLRYGRSV